jgi:hypothetical protein
MGEVQTENIARHSRVRATEEAVIIWALASTQYPIDHRVIQEKVTVMLIEAVSSFAIDARRALESFSERSGIKLVEPRWNWVPKREVVKDLWDSESSNTRKKLDVGWEEILANISAIAAGAIVVPYVQAETDRRPLAFIDPFAMAHAFLYSALAILDSRSNTSAQLQ